MAFTSLDQIKAANRAADNHWFSPGALRFFSSRILSTVYGGRFFVTSEKFRDVRYGDGPRRYTVRRVDDDGTIDTVGEFQAYRTRAQAIAAAKRAALAESDLV